MRVIHETNKGALRVDEIRCMWNAGQCLCFEDVHGNIITTKELQDPKTMLHKLVNTGMLDLTVMTYTTITGTLST